MACEHRIETHQERVFSSGILSVTTTYRLLITGDTDLKELDRLIRILTLQKQILEEADAEAPHAPEASAGEHEDTQPGQVQGEPQAAGGADGKLEAVSS